MLVIRREQMQAFRDAMEQMFQRQVAIQLRHAHPRESSGISIEAMSSLIKDGTGKAESYGIVGGDDIQRYLVYMLKHGHDFDTDQSRPELQEILESPDLDGETKLNEVGLCLGRIKEV